MHICFFQNGIDKNIYLYQCSLQYINGDKKRFILDKTLRGFTYVSGKKLELEY